MGLEIERKFLVTDESYKTQATSFTIITQGYLSTDPDRTVRIRVAGTRAWITVKSRNSGCVRCEWEYEIPVDDAREMLTMCGHTLDKTRYRAGRWEIDEFHGEHAGLTIAEIELSDEHEAFEKPDFIGEEVTGNPRYYNSSLSATAE